MTPALLSRLNAERAAGRAVVLLTRLSDGEQHLWPEDAVPGALAEAARRALGTDETANLLLDGEAWFVEPHNPKLRLVIVGAVHIAQALAPMAPAMGFAVTIVDPRRAFATPERFAGVALSHDWPDEAMAALAPDARTAIVTLTHDPKIDDPALEAALASNAFYVGALGSRKTHAARLERLAAKGFDEAARKRIRGPVGLAIGALSPAEIAISIVAEITQVRRGA